MTTKSKRIPFVIAGIVGCFAIVLLVVIVAGGVYFFVARGQLPTIAQQAKNGEIKDPIVAILVASSLDNKGRVVDPKFTFDATQPQMTVVIQAGKVTNAPLDFVWYQVTDEGDQKLFDHHVQVTSYERAYSIGKNPGLLASGTYKVAATLGGQTKTIEFDVTQKAAQPATGGAPVSTQQVKPPVDGGSGKTSSPASSTAPSGPTPQWWAWFPCNVTVGAGEGSNEDSQADIVEVVSDADCQDTEAIRVSARVSGDFRELGVYAAAKREHDTAYFYLDPCSLSGGSDLPGTKVEVIATANDSSQTQVARGVITLADDTLPPRVQPLKTTPANGKKVKAGDKIDITVTAQEKRKNGPWQTGVKVIHVRETKVSGGHEFFTWRNPDGAPKPCAEKTWEHTEHTSYTVPQNPPPVIEICASSEDWIKAGPETCYQYPTGNTWKGKFHTVSSFFGCCSEPLPTYVCSNDTWDGEFQVVVGGNGDVQGKGSMHLVQPPQCSPPLGGCRAAYFEFDVKGTFGVKGAFDRGQFQLQFYPSSVSPSRCISTVGYSLFSGSTTISSQNIFTVPVIAPGDAEGQVSGEGHGQTASGYPYGKGQHTIRMLCEDCK